MLSDLRIAFRSLARMPGLATAIIVTLALGIGANTAIFSFFNAILLGDLPYADPERIVVIKKDARDFGDPMGVEVGLLAADYRDLQPQVQSFESLAAYTLDAATLSGRGPADLAVGAIVTRNFFSVLGSHAMLGRTFTEADAGGAADHVAVLANSYWQSRLGGDPAILGQTITLNRVSFTVVGVMPPDFEFPREAGFWVTPAGDVPENAIGTTNLDYGGRGNYLRTMLGRLRPGVSSTQAELELAALIKRLPNPGQAQRAVHLVTMRDQAIGSIRPALTVLLACVGLVLLIVCLNVANLMLSRATTRQREIGVRLALGGSRFRITRQMLSESMVLALIGGGAGVLLSAWGLDVLVRLAPESLPRLATVHIDGGVLAFASVITLLTGLVCGLVPVLSAKRFDLVAMIKSGGDRGGSAGEAARRLRSLLVAGEVAIAMILLVAAGLLLRSLEKMRAAAWGFDPGHVVSARVVFMDDHYATEASQRVFLRTLLDKLEATPGFEAVGLSLDRIGQSWVQMPFMLEGKTYATPADAPQAALHVASPDYFRTLGITLLQGRSLARTDDENTDLVVVVDATLARQHFPIGEALGKRIGVPLPGGIRWATIVGVTAPVKSDGLAGQSRPDIYFAPQQVPVNNVHVHVRTRLDVANVGNTITDLVHQIDADVPVSDLATMEQVIARPADARRFPLGLLGTFATMALTLAGLGIYAVTAHGVAQRTREIGVRMALGAQPRRVVALVVRQSFSPIITGVFIGLIGAALTALAMRGLLFGVEPLDGPTFFAIPIVLALVAGLASWLPVRQATRIDPIIALRAD